MFMVVDFAVVFHGLQVSHHFGGHSQFIRQTLFQNRGNVVCLTNRSHARKEKMHLDDQAITGWS
jgi:hypothetical protein